MDLNNPLIWLDGYKTDHVRQYPPGTTFCYTNFTPRNTKHFKGLEDYDDKICVFGLSAVWRAIYDAWMDHFFMQPKDEILRDYEEFMKIYLGVDKFDVSHISELHDLGYLPIKIKAIDEGERVNVNVPLFTICNTLPEFFWLPNYLETQLSSLYWKVITTATTAFEFKTLFMRYALDTCESIDFVDFQGHDFSMRGMSGVEDAFLNGAAHLALFKGTDTIPAIYFVKEFYDNTGFVGGSVPATEHSVMTMYGKENEKDCIRHLITEVYPKGIVSIVSDTWDFWNVISNISEDLKEDILSRDGKLVFRPDSGKAIDIICGNPNAIGAPQAGALNILWDIFGGTINSWGYKVLNPHVGLIYGDSISLEIAEDILERMESMGFASSNIVFGIGSFTYQHVTRDTLGTAMKATFAIVDGEERELFKDPITDNGVKKSAKGRLRVEKDEFGDFTLYQGVSEEDEKEGMLEILKAYVKLDFTDIREKFNRHIFEIIDSD